MAKLQRSITIEEDVYFLIKKYADLKKLSFSHAVERFIVLGFREANVTVREVREAVKVLGTHATDEQIMERLAGGKDYKKEELRLLENMEDYHGKHSDYSYFMTLDPVDFKSDLERYLDD